MCNFPARELLAYHQQVIADADNYGPEKLTYSYGVVKAINDLVDFHEFLTGCPCWDDLMVEEGWLEPKTTIPRKPVERATGDQPWGTKEAT